MEYNFKDCQSVDEIRLKKQEALDKVKQDIAQAKEAFYIKQKEEARLFEERKERELNEAQAVINNAYMEAYEIVGKQRATYKRVPITYLSNTIPQSVDMYGLKVIFEENSNNDTIRIDDAMRIYV